MDRQCSLSSETTPVDILRSSGLVMPRSPPHHHDAQNMPKRRKGQHKRTWCRNSLKALYNTMAVSTTTTPFAGNLDVQAALSMQVGALQRQLCERDMELMLLRDTLSMLLAKKCSSKSSRAPTPATQSALLHSVI